MPQAATTTNLINGEWREMATVHEVRNPVDDSVVGQITFGGAAEAEQAATAAAEAFQPWADTPVRERAALLSRTAALIEDRADEIGTLLAREAGKRKPEAIGEVRFAAEYFRWFAEEVRRPIGAVHAHEAANRRHLSIHRPAGVVASLTPWNYPVSIQARKLAPALAAGCTVVARVRLPLESGHRISCGN
ncbi:possible succinate-semialdehyde dehydrogenase (NAD(P)+), N-terminal (plasmid) [Rhodococcus jostii RHA1]|uniref:Possible succinate-semialdehyde dehydrogenase (NAD(P)+), N-terminal n=1 Tax=Rhodococcus jostii (strain RHA1) TaxID=101510 RepID=Q0RXV7_RHOJR|nr:aldehyde dehydrogenase family protein [Rhodococcus jostii]ABG99879.1 possible succinate-semialdehyde dehydrogenase (NAD(P)+), N-terminal [Rhodococcus jostii RHA1]